MNFRRALAWLLAGSLVTGVALRAAGDPAIQTADLKEWLTYLASDELEGRPTFGAGLGLAAGYLEAHLAAWGVEPAGDHGGYLQTVKVLGVRTTSRASVTVHVGDKARTFKDGEGVTFPRDMGGKRTLTLDRVEFAGYGFDAPSVNHNDFAGRSVTGAAVVYLGANGPKLGDAQKFRRLLNGRSRHALDQLGAAAAIAPGGTSERTAVRAADTSSGPTRQAPDFTRWLARFSAVAAIGLLSAGGARAQGQVNVYSYREPALIAPLIAVTMLVVFGVMVYKKLRRPAVV